MRISATVAEVQPNLSHRPGNGSVLLDCGHTGVARMRTPIGAPVSCYECRDTPTTAEEWSGRATAAKEEIVNCAFADTDKSPAKEALLAAAKAFREATNAWLRAKGAI